MNVMMPSLAAAAATTPQGHKRSYWIEHSVDLWVESMMLDSKASNLNKEERNKHLFDRQTGLSRNQERLKSQHQFIDEA
ncbi:hypothetical protein PIB30_097158, partial [Stylosanthes scabra]|nr:hypothetical protein [Stylosanthes scabra]